MTAEETAAILATTGLNTEKQIQILMDKGLTRAEAEAAVATAAHSAQNVGATATTGLLSTATASLSAVLKGLWATLMANPIIAVVAIMAALAVAMVKVAGAAKEASEAADEFKAKSMEESQAAREEIQTLDELISKYKELAESENQDSGTRNEIKSIQSDITDLVGTQADNLDLVNGKLDEEIEKLNQIRKDEADKAVNKATTAYHAAKDSHDKAIGQDSALWIDGYAYVSDDWWGNEDDVIDILQNNGFKSSVQKGGVFNSHTFIMDSQDENYKMLEGATEKAEFLKRMIAVIEENYSDYASSDIWNALNAQVEIYEDYADDMKKAAKDLAEAEILSSIYDDSLSNISVDSLENYSNYREKLIDLVKNSPNLSEAIQSGDLSSEDIEGQVDNYLATIPKYSDYYKQFSKLEEQKKKIADVKKAFTDSDWIQDASWSIAEQRLNDFNDWFDNLSDEDKEIVYNVSCNTDTAKFNLIDWQNALANYSDYTKLTAKEIENNLNVATKNTTELISGISSAQDILSSQSTGMSLSVEDFNSDELADYRSALEYTNGTMQLNIDKVNEIINAKSKEQIEINNTNKAMAQSTYLDNASQIEKLRQKIKDKNFAEGESEESIQNNIDALLKENETIKSNCDAYDLMTSSLQEATNAYNNWLNAQNASQSGDMFDDTLDAINRINETLNDTGSDYFGRVGRTDYKAAIELIVPESIDPEDSEKVNAYLKSVYDLFTYDDEGNYSGLNIANFCQKAVDAGLMVLDESGENYRIAGSKTMEDFAEGLNLSLPLVQAMFGEMEEFGGEFSWADEANKTIGDLAVSANVAAENLRGLHSDMTITLDVSDLTTAKEKSDALDSTIKQMQDLKATVGVDAEEVEYANSIISYCITQKQQLSEPVILDVDVSKVSETTGEAVLLIQDFQKACNDLELKKALGLDTTDAQAKVDELYSQITSSDNDALLALKLDTTSVETVKSSIAGLTIEDIKAKLQIDDTALLSYQPEDKKATVKYDVDTSKVDNYNPKNLSRTVTYYVRTVGSVKANGTANLTGTAKAGGDWGTAQGGQTLTGELGREIVVDPHTGRWYTVGDTGAEFVNIPRGAIVFNHKQTESLLKNGYVAGRASALVGGTAMVTGGIGVGNANNSTTSGGNSTSNYGKTSNSKSNKSSNSDDDKIEAFDWIEIAIDRIERAIDRLKKTAESTYKSLKSKLGATADEITKVNQKIALQQQAYNRYMQEANSVGLDSGLAEKVRNGTIDINQYDEDTRNLINDYQDWYIIMPLYTAMYIEEFI